MSRRGFVRSRGLLVLGFCGLMAAGCVQQPMQSKISEFNREVREPRILLMPVDIQLSELSAGGMQEPKAEWTDAARSHIVDVLKEEQDRRGNRMIQFRDDPTTSEDDERVREISKLHGIVGATVTLHSLPQLKLPNKGDKFDWALGPDVQRLRKDNEADYALFVYIRDSYASEGRVALIAIGALLGVGIQGGVQVGYASLVDLQSGEIVWFNKIARGTGDLRTRGPAQETMRLLLVGLPK